MIMDNRTCEHYFIERHFIERQKQPDKHECEF